MADKIPSPVEELENQTKADEAELTNLREESEKTPDETEELAEESLPSEDTDEPEAEPDQPEEDEPVVEEQESESSDLAELEALSKRGQERFKKLNQRLKETSADKERLQLEKENLLNVVKTLQEQGYTRKEAQEMAPQMNLDPNQDYQDYAKQVQLQAQQAARQVIEQERMVEAHHQKVERFKEDLSTVEKEYEVLNEDSPEYDEKLSNFVAEVYESRANKDPKVRLVDIAKEIISVREKGANEAVTKQEAKIRKKVASQALPSSGGKTLTSSLADQLANVDSEAELLELKKKLPLGD